MQDCGAGLEGDTVSPRPALTENALYLYRPAAGSKVSRRYIEVRKVIDQGGRWWVLGHDYSLGRDIKLQPGQIGAPARPLKG